MAKEKFVYATRMQLYMIFLSTLFVIGIAIYATFFDKTTPAPLPVFALIIGLMTFMCWFMWRSYKGKLPLMRIEEH